MEYKVNVIIEPKPYLSDPEGDTILKDLIAKGGYSSVKKVRTAKMLTITIDAENREEAETIVKRLCDELRIYNPVASDCKVYAVTV
ncbi:MAG: phosphoribosylformylglycinamidine synthase, purS protein [Candidatus Nitrosothermus koennekii]|nr:MAG: phosphoribosylformylglycinamidine synthase, purS protein [Candidatus Nitrosothermus koennekii]